MSNSSEMNGSNNLQKQHEAFRKAMQNQPTLTRPAAVTSSGTLLIEPVARHTPSPASSMTSSTTVGSRPINSYVHAILSYLKDAERPVPLEEIFQKLNVNLHSQTDVLDRILRNERISYDEHGSMLEYHAVFAIKSKQDIITLLKQRPNLVGIEYAELKESNPRIDEYINELVKEREIFLVRTKDDGPKVVFLNDTKTRGPVDEIFRQLWMSTIVSHDERELRRALEAVGLKAHGHPLERPNKAVKSEASGGREGRKSSAKRPFRRIKITNDYLDNIDLNIDPAGL